MKTYILIIFFFLSMQSSNSQIVNNYDIYTQIFNDKIDSFYYDEPSKELVYLSKVYSENEIINGEYIESDEVISKLSTGNLNYNYYLYSVYHYDHFKKSFEFKKFIIESKYKNRREWNKLDFKEVYEKDLTYDCFEKKIENVIYLKSIGTGNKIVIQKDENNRYIFLTIGNDCEILDTISLEKSIKVFQNDKVICFYDGIIYLFAYSDL